jgi:hypothetical protein
MPNFQNLFCNNCLRPIDMDGDYFVIEHIVKHKDEEIYGPIHSYYCSTNCLGRPNTVVGEYIQMVEGE